MPTSASTAKPRPRKGCLFPVATNSNLRINLLFQSGQIKYRPGIWFSLRGRGADPGFPCFANAVVHLSDHRIIRCYFILFSRIFAAYVRHLTIEKADGLFKVKVVPFGGKGRSYLPEKVFSVSFSHERQGIKYIRAAIGKLNFRTLSTG